MKKEEFPEVSKIVLKSVFSKDRKLILQPTKDARSGWYKGVPRLSEADKKDLKFWVDPSSSLTITHNMVFNLHDEVDKQNWAWVSESNAIALSFEECQQSKEALFYVDSEEVESRKSVDADELLHKAMDYILKDRSDMLADRARILGHNMEGESPTVVKEMLLKIAKNAKTVHKIIDAYENNSTAIHLLFLKARDKDIIKLENGAFLYGGSVLGVNQEAAIKSMQDPMNRELILEMEKEMKASPASTAPVVD